MSWKFQKPTPMSQVTDQNKLQDKYDLSRKEKRPERFNQKADSLTLWFRSQSEKLPKKHNDVSGGTYMMNPQTTRRHHYPINVAPKIEFRQSHDNEDDDDDDDDDDAPNDAKQYDAVDKRLQSGGSLIYNQFDFKERLSIVDHLISNEIEEADMADWHRTKRFIINEFDRTQNQYRFYDTVNHFLYSRGLDTIPVPKNSQ
jgi:hypothetical protein